MQRYDIVEEESAVFLQRQLIFWRRQVLMHFQSQNQSENGAKFSIAFFSTFMMLTWVTQALFKRM